MPYNDIRAKLFARIITESSPIETGDSMDIKNIACMAPCCNMMLTDKKMKNRIQELSIDVDYKVKVFSVKDYEEMIYYISNIQ